LLQQLIQLYGERDLADTRENLKIFSSGMRN